MNSIVVRKCAPGEIGQVKALFEAVFTDPLFGHTPVFEETTSGEQIYIALLDGKMVGFASLWEPDCFIHYLCVSPEARHRRVGAAIVSTLAQRCGSPLTLKCLTANTDALAFYRATGWTKTACGTGENGAYVLLTYPVQGKP